MNTLSFNALLEVEKEKFIKTVTKLEKYNSVFNIIFTM